MKNLMPVLLVATLLSGCGLLPPPSPIMMKDKTVKEDASDKTITLHQEIVRPHPSGKYIYLPKGIYKHVATDGSHFYFEAPTSPLYATKQSEKGSVRLNRYFRLKTYSSSVSLHPWQENQESNSQGPPIM